MDPEDTGQATAVTESPAAGNGKPPEFRSEGVPVLGKRQRKKNPKYADDETNNASPHKPCATSPEVAGATPAKTPKRRGRPPKNAAKSEAKRQAGTPARGRKAPNKTPAGRPAAKDEAAKNEAAKDEAAAGDAAQQENGTAKPKRRSAKKQQLDSVPEPPPDPEPTEPEEDVQPGGRRRRGAARAALKYLHIVAKEVLSPAEDELVSQPSPSNENSEKTRPPGGQARRGRKRKCLDSGGLDDEDFVPECEDEAEGVAKTADEDEEEEKEEDLDLDTDFRTRRRSSAGHQKYAPCESRRNGLSVNVTRSVWDATEATRKHREEHLSSWVFPNWIPSSADWTPVPSRDVEQYLPQELQSAAFRVSRENLTKEAPPPQCLGRFESLPFHPERWDASLFAGGPVWALEWCPTPDGVPAAQYLALSCHRGMDDQHQVNRTYGGAGLVQLWDVSRLEYGQTPDRRPALSYGLAQDLGFIWTLKWCPAGGWEPPAAPREPPSLPRLGLLAVAFSSSVVSVFSLPHPDALLADGRTAESGGENPAIFKARPVVTLKLGSFRAPRLERSGLVLSLDWLPLKPHNVIAVGFYDGMVGLWDLTTESALLRVRESTGGLSLLPYRSFLAHHGAVRVLTFCPASRFLLMSAGDDHNVKTWDLRRLWSPASIPRRHLANELHWLLHCPGFMIGQESSFASKGSHGLHYIDYCLRSIMVVPRRGTIWSFSYSDWLHSVVTADSLGEVILALLPPLDRTPLCVKRFVERRIPIFLTSLVPPGPAGGGSDEEEEEEAEKPPPTGGNQEDGTVPSPVPSPVLRVRRYREVVKKYCVQHTDSDMETFAGLTTRKIWKHMKDEQTKRKQNLDETPLAALHKVRFNPNLGGHVWVASGGQAGLVRLSCVKSLISSQVEKMLGQRREHSSPPEEEEEEEEEEDQPSAR